MALARIQQVDVEEVAAALYDELEAAEAVRLVVSAHVRHAETHYDELLSQGCERWLAQAEVESQVARVLARWQGTR